MVSAVISYSYYVVTLGGMVRGTDAGWTAVQICGPVPVFIFESENYVSNQGLRCLIVDI